VAAGYLNNLLSSFGAPAEGPDPSRLEGLLEILQSGEMDSQELSGHLLRMQSRIQEALRDRQGSYAERSHLLGPEVSALIERNLGACQVLEETLGQLAVESNQEVQAVYERAIREFLESSDQLSELATSSQPVCPRCGSRGSENLCSACEIDRLIPDPDVADMEYSRAVVGEEFLAVYQAYAQVVEGEAGLEPLLQALQSLELSLLEAQALAEQAAEDSPPHEALLVIINEAVEGVNRLHAVQENRLTRELHQGWAQVFKAAVVVQQLLAVAQGEVEEFYEDQDESADD
jgi:hypothetical protein